MSSAICHKIAMWLLRIALAASFLSAVADRFGFWGGPGQPQVAWGAWRPFVDYTGVLLFYLPPSVVTASAVLATAAEMVLALWLLTGWQLRMAAFASAALLALFAASMVVSLGWKAPLDYSVFTAAAAAFALAMMSVPTNSRPKIPSGAV